VRESAPQKTKQGFPKSRRLLRHRDFEGVYKRGKRHFATHLTVFYLRREQGERGWRVGFTVGKQLGGAVQRNRIKRRLREAVRLNMKGTTTRVDIVINPKRSTLTADFRDLQDEITHAFRLIERATKSETGGGPSRDVKLG